eukprot:5670499-Prymnesium_polylepis.1
MPMRTASADAVMRIAKMPDVMEAWDAAMLDCDGHNPGGSGVEAPTPTSRKRRRAPRAHTARPGARTAEDARPARRGLAPPLSRARRTSCSRRRLDSVHRPEKLVHPRVQLLQAGHLAHLQLELGPQRPGIASFSLGEVCRVGECRGGGGSRRRNGVAGGRTGSTGRSGGRCCSRGLVSPQEPQQPPCALCVLRADPCQVT